MMAWNWAGGDTAMDLARRRAEHAERLDEALRRVGEVLSGVEGVQRVSLFGSAARGRRDLFTDLDLLVIWETDRPLVERLKALYSLLHLPVDLDVLCYTPAEFHELSDAPFLRRIAQEEVVLFETKAP
jgi:predicted nucleotidyltransferase